jgi:nicotinamide mononucleotide transporter
VLALTEIIAVVLAVVYLALAIWQNPLCWPAALISVALFSIVYFESRLYMQAALQIYYFAMGIYGWLQWKRGGDDEAGVTVRWWTLKSHGVALALVLVATVLSGGVLSGTDARFPYFDSFATVAALVGTWLLAKKYIENWIYWFVIDAVLVCLSWLSGLYWTAGLYALYLIMVVTGFVSWRKSMTAPGSEGDASAAF